MFVAQTTLLKNDRPPRPNLKESEAYCRRFTRAHRENFVVGSILLPKEMRQHFANIYTFCRSADDLSDEISVPEESLHELSKWEKELLSCYEGTPSHLAFIALHSTIREFSIPAQPFLDLLSAFRQDQTKSRYSDYEDLIQYCCNSANPVGHLILYLSRSFDERRVELSNQICTGLQLANFIQDVGSDFRRGRVYLPEDLCKMHGVNDSMLAASSASKELRDLLKDLSLRTETLFDAGSQLIEDVPAWLRADLRLFIDGGRAVIAAVRRAEFDVLANRCSVSRWTAAKLVSNALFRNWFG